jgi:hypothetical protein
MTEKCELCGAPLPRWEFWDTAGYLVWVYRGECQCDVARRSLPADLSSGDYEITAAFGKAPTAAKYFVRVA